MSNEGIGSNCGIVSVAWCSFRHQEKVNLPVMIFWRVDIPVVLLDVGAQIYT